LSEAVVGQLGESAQPPGKQLDITARKLRDLRTACRILAAEGQEHFSFGHVSARAERSGQIWMKPSGLGLGEMELSDFVLLDAEGKRLSAGAPLHHEWPIHTEIYRKRADVDAIVHTHPLVTAAFSAASGTFQMVCQDSLLFNEGIAFYDDARLIVTPERGTTLADTLGDLKAVVLRHHGLVIAAASIQEAVVLAVSLDRSLRVQMMAACFGAVKPMRVEEVREMSEYFGSSYPGRLQSIWDYLERKSLRLNPAMRITDAGVTP
jgi:L-fuculose-phosphate aldolase